MATAHEKRRPVATYEGDFYGWALDQARLLKEGQFAELDLANLAEEVKDVARSQARELRCRYAVLLQHLLKFEFQPARRSRSWVKTISLQRIEIEDLLAQNPGLSADRATLFASAYGLGRGRARIEAGLGKTTLPTTCPYTLDQAMDGDFWPGEPWPGFAAAGDVS